MGDFFELVLGLLLVESVITYSFLYNLVPCRMNVSIYLSVCLSSFYLYLLKLLVFFIHSVFSFCEVYLCSVCQLWFWFTSCFIWSSSVSHVWFYFFCLLIISFSSVSSSPITFLYLYPLSSINSCYYLLFFFPCMFFSWTFLSYSSFASTKYTKLVFFFYWEIKPLVHLQFML